MTKIVTKEFCLIIITPYAELAGIFFHKHNSEEQDVKGVCRKLDAESSPSDSCTFKRRRSAQFHPSPFERSFSQIGPISGQIGAGMDMS